MTDTELMDMLTDGPPKMLRSSAIQYSTAWRLDPVAQAEEDGAIRRIRERCEREGDEWLDDPVFPGEDDR